MTEWDIGQHFIAILATDAFSANEPAFFKVLDHSLDRSLGDSDSRSNLPQHQFGLRVKHDQNVGVIGQKRPPRAALFRVLHCRGGRLDRADRRFLGT